MGIVHEPIDDGIGDRWFSNDLVPFWGWMLGSHNYGVVATAILEDFEQVTALLIGERCQAPVNMPGP